MNRWQDISISDASLKAEFITKFFDGDYIDAFTIISNNPQLNTKAFVADTINQITTILLSLENNFQNGVIDYLSQQYSNFQNIIDNYNLRGNWSSSTTYQIYNFVTYNNIDYLYINLTPSSGNIPTNTDYWVEINIQGEKGAPGLGVNLQYNWSTTTPYNALDVVYYNNALWVARVTNINKIPGSTEEWETLSGSIVSFYNDGDIEISNLSVVVEPVQAGRGDPSPDNVRPFTAFTSATIWSTGKNIYRRDYLKKGGNYVELMGIHTPTTADSTKKRDGVSLRAGHSYRLYFDLGVTKQYGIYATRTGSTSQINVISNANRRYVNMLYTPPADAYYCFWIYTGGGTASVVLDNVVFQLYPDGGTFEEVFVYQGNKYTVDFGQTVYAGSLDVVNGKLSAYPYYASYNGEALVGPWLSSMDVYAEGSTPTIGAEVVDMGGTPTVYDIDPVQIATIAGQTNNVWADAGDVSVELDKKYWEEFIKFKLASIYTDYIEPSAGSLYNGLIWFEVFNPQNWNYLTNRNYTWNQINTNNDTWESVDRGDY